LPIKKASDYRLRLFHLVGRTGFEPATPWSQTRYSTGLNYLPIPFGAANIRLADGFSGARAKRPPKNVNLARFDRLEQGLLIS
jgi:hypothetical protein